MVSGRRYGKLLREAARDNKLGDPARVWNAAETNAKMTPNDIETAANKWKARVEEAVGDDYEEVQYASRKAIKPVEPRRKDKADEEEDFLVLELVKVVATDDGGFGDDEGEEERIIHTHSMVRLKTGEIFGVDADGSPTWHEGPRAHASHEDSYANALNEKSGMLRLFGATVSELVLSLCVPVDSPDAFGETALMQAAACGHVDMVRWLLDFGKAESNKATEAGVTALMIAVEKGSSDHEKIVKLLVELGGADVNARNVWGTSALHLAAFRGMLDMAKLLVQLGADASQKNNEGNTPAYYSHEDSCFSGSDGSIHYSADLEAYLASL